MEEKRELRMYFFVMYNLSPIQQGIQAGHCVEEYADKFGQSELYKEYRKHKTWIILNGGTSNSGLVIPSTTPYTDQTKWGSMEIYEQYLLEHNIQHSSFHEPNLNDSLSALCFICDNKVFDWENFPPFEKWAVSKHSFDSIELGILQKGVPPYYNKFNSTVNKLYKRWVRLVGGEQNAKLKGLILGKKLA
jgi:hypothetical protein